MSETKPIVYEMGDVTVTRLSQEVRKLWSDLQEDPTQLSKFAEDKGISVDDLLQEECPIVVQSGGGGTGIVEGAIVVAFITSYAGPVLKEITVDLWREFILKRLKKRFGDEAVGDEIKETPEK